MKGAGGYWGCLGRHRQGLPGPPGTKAAWGNGGLVGLHVTLGWGVVRGVFRPDAVEGV